MKKYTILTPKQCRAYCDDLTPEEKTSFSEVMPQLGKFLFMDAPQEGLYKAELDDKILFVRGDGERYVCVPSSMKAMISFGIIEQTELSEEDWLEDLEWSLEDLEVTSPFDNNILFETLDLS